MLSNNISRREKREPRSWGPVNIFSSFLSLKISFIDFSDSKQTRLRRKMKTDKSLVPLFTFPPPLLAALFLLAGCHYKALQGMVWAIGVGHRARWRSPMFQTPWHAHAFSLSHTHTHIRTFQSDCTHHFALTRAHMLSGRHARVYVHIRVH